MNPTERSIKSIRVVEKYPEDQTKPQPGTSRRNSSQLKSEKRPPRRNIDPEKICQQEVLTTR